MSKIKLNHKERRIGRNAVRNFIENNSKKITKSNNYQNNTNNKNTEIRIDVRSISFLFCIINFIVALISYFMSIELNWINIIVAQNIILSLFYSMYKNK